MCGHGGKRMMKVWVLDGKDKKTLACFQVDGYELAQYISLMNAIGMNIQVQGIVKNGKRRDIKIRARLTGLEKVIDRIHNITLC